MKVGDKIPESVYINDLPSPTVVGPLSAMRNAEQFDAFCRRSKQSKLDPLGQVGGDGRQDVATLKRVRHLRQKVTTVLDDVHGLQGQIPLDPGQQPVVRSDDILPLIFSGDDPSRGPHTRVDHGEVDRFARKPGKRVA